MSESALIEKITTLAMPLAASLHLEIWGVELGLGAKSHIRIFVEKIPVTRTAHPLPTGAQSSDAGEIAADIAVPDSCCVSIEECAQLSRLVGLSLEVDDLFTGPYVLEVSSPGLERVFFKPEQLRRYIGSSITLQVHSDRPQYPGRKKFNGFLGNGHGDDFTLIPEDAPKPGEKPQPISFSWDEIQKIRLAHVFPDTKLPGKTKRSAVKKNSTKKDPSGNEPRG